MGLFKFNEEKLFDEINKLSKDDLTNELNNTFMKYKRLRQTWQYGPKEIRKDDLLYKIKQKITISDGDIEQVKKESIEGGVAANDKILTWYVEVLNNTKELQEKLAKLREDYELSGSKKDKVEINNPPPSVKEQEKSLETMIKRNVEGLERFFYGDRNFIQEGAFKCFKNHKKIFDLALKCKKEKYEKVIDKNKKSKKPITEDKLLEHSIIFKKLQKLTNEVYGDDNKYGLKLPELEKAYGTI